MVTNKIIDRAVGVTNFWLETSFFAKPPLCLRRKKRRLARRAQISRHHHHHASRHRYELAVLHDKDSARFVVCTNDLVSKLRDLFGKFSHLPFNGNVAVRSSLEL